MYSSSETRALTKLNLQSQYKARAMLRRICNIEPEEVVTVRSRELLAKFKLKDLDLILREKALLNKHVELS